MTNTFQVNTRLRARLRAFQKLGGTALHAVQELLHLPRVHREQRAVLVFHNRVCQSLGACEPPLRRVGGTPTEHPEAGIVCHLIKAKKRCRGTKRTTVSFMCHGERDGCVQGNMEQETKKKGRYGQCRGDCYRRRQVRKVGAYSSWLASIA